nr:DNA methyltransferase [Plesiomonas shigelloides]
MNKYNDLVKKLKEIFQIDRPELDFGIYRILNARADEINDYLDNKLKAKIQAALKDAGNANKAELEQQLQAAIKAATDAGFEPDQSPKVQDLRKQLAGMASGSVEHENAVFSHLLTFFSRYYDNGDFISKRRYKGDTYAIPYAGEEVMLHWVNKDQYYIKSGENFANYAFKLDDGRKVSFKLLAADTAKDNRKDNDADRRFVLIEPHTRTKLDEEGEEFEQAYQPVEVVKTTALVNGEAVETEELVIHFEYKAMKKGTKQDALVQSAIASILADRQVQQYWAELAKRAPTESNPSRTELERHLTTYTQRNTADYFIHKDLGGFLTNELDFYIKNEVMNLDNLQNAQVFANIEKQLRMIQCLRAVAQELITFLAQIENFQKKLWEKKKFVVKTDYLITTNNLSDELLGQVVENDAQWDEWRRDGVWVPKHNGTLDDLKSRPYRLVNTELYTNQFKYKLLNEIENVDRVIDGLLISSDNFQGLNLLSSKYGGVIDCIYIDPPYNTDASAILYKNGYKSSSWASLINDRVAISAGLLKNNGVLVAAIDDAQQRELNYILSENFNDNILGTICVRSNPSGRPMKTGYSVSHEYLFFAGKSLNSSISRLPPTDEQMRRFNQSDEEGVFEWRNLRREGSNSDRGARPALFYPIYISGTCFRVPSLEWDEDNKRWIALENPAQDEKVTYPINDDGQEKTWRWEWKKVVKDASLLAVRKDRSGNDYVYYKRRPNSEGVVSVSSWFDAKHSSTEHGSNLLKNMFGTATFTYPKSIYAVEDAIYIAGANNAESITLDYFAGSGTTAHAVLNLNRKDSGHRKYILIEQAEYFDSITVPRVRKAIYAGKWQKGLPVENGDDLSQICKVMRLESYEDVLNNIDLIRDKSFSDLFDSVSEKVNDDYLINYMLQIESQRSLINLDSFHKPFNYEMDIAEDSSGSINRKHIDLVETFNYLLGLYVKSIESNIERGYVRIEGTLPTGERTLILWRDCDKIGYDKLNDYANRFDLYAKEQTFDVIYINGDHNLPTAFTVDGDDGEILRSLKLRQIEPEFLSLMFAEEA